MPVVIGRIKNLDHTNGPKMSGGVFSQIDNVSPDIGN
jgi:hypothetical protein